MLDIADITILGAFTGGIVSFASPCILPLVPLYLANIAGASVLTPDPPARRHILLHTISFVVGFSLVYTPLGALLGLLGAAVPQGVLEKVAGALLIAFGIFLIAVTKVPWLNYEKRLDFGKARGTGYLRSLLIGIIFSVGWIPCTSGILGIISTAAVRSQTAWRGAYLLLAYCLGLGLPFIAVGLAWGAVSRYLKWISRHYSVILIVAGVLLISVGILMLTGYLEYLMNLMPGGYQYDW
jgi:cytochrome c-type biogenesis protein